MDIIKDNEMEVISVCISEKKGTKKHRVEHIEVKKNHGIVGDAHAGDWHRQVSFLAIESLEKMKKRFQILIPEILQKIL